MDFYPREFPIESQDRVEAESIRAGLLFDRLRESLLYSPGSQYGLANMVRDLLVDCILKTWAAFAHEACELGHQNVWSAVEIDLQVRKFLENATRHISADRGFDTCGTPLEGMQAAVQERFRESSEKKVYEKERLGVAERSETDPFGPSESLSQPDGESISERLDHIVLSQGISHEELAHRMGVSRSRYFEVKAGRGGKKARAKASLYLSSLDTST